MKFLSCVTIAFLVTLFASGCGASAEELDSAATAAVATYQETIAAIPTATLMPTSTPYPTYTPEPSSTPLPTYEPLPTYTPFPTSVPLTADIGNLYCNFDFCIRYPEDPRVSIADYAIDYIDDLVGELNEPEEGGYSWLTEDGVIIFLDWRTDTLDTPNERVDWWLDDSDYVDVGEVTEITVDDLDVAYGIYTLPTVSTQYRTYAAWRCGPRLFTYLIGSEEDVDLIPLLENSLVDFTCLE